LHKLKRVILRESYCLILCFSCWIFSFRCVRCSTI